MCSCGPLTGQQNVVSPISVGSQTVYALLHRLLGLQPTQRSSSRRQPAARCGQQADAKKTNLCAGSPVLDPFLYVLLARLDVLSCSRQQIHEVCQCIAQQVPVLQARAQTHCMTDIIASDSFGPRTAISPCVAWTAAEQECTDST